MSAESSASDQKASTSIPITAAGGGGGLRQPPGPPNAKWRVIPKIEKDPRFIAYMQRESGRKALIAIALTLAVLSLFDGIDFSVAPIAVLCGFIGKRRLYLLPLATFALLCKHGFWVDANLVQHVIGQEGLESRINQSVLFYGMVAFVLALCSGLLIVWPRMAPMPWFRRPTLCLILAVIALSVAAQLPITAGMPRVVLWSFLATFLPYLWFLAYALSDAATLSRRPFWEHLGVFHPFWGSTMTPFGKGLAYLTKFEAKTPEELAVTQLKGVKLACWTLLLAACLTSFERLVHGYLAVQQFDDVFLEYVAGAHYPRSLCWASLVASFFEETLKLTIWGGAIVASARLAGFRLLRNTYRPLEATTIAEFWNRYYFYYKELLVDHFFYPVFLSCFRANRRLRMFFATFMAACVGNILFHFIRDIHFVAELGWRKAISGEASHAFYTFLLALGVGISQMRPRNPTRNQGWLRGRLLPCLWVTLFYCVLHVFDAPQDRVHSIWQRAEFLSYLLGAGLWF